MVHPFGNNPPQSVPYKMRDTLYGDAPLDQWPPASSGQTAEPWASFIQAREAVARGNQAEAVAIWQRITHMPDLESRHYVQAWHFLRQADIQPPADQAKVVYGVVIEVGMPQGLDVLAAYLDGTARYYNYSGAAVIWEKPDDSLAPDINALLEAGRQVAALIGPWDQARPPAPDRDVARLSMLTPSGLHFGQGPMQMLGQDPKGRMLLVAGSTLMQKLTQRAMDSR